LIGNRDEFFHRAAAVLAEWPDSPIIAGRDLQSGGAWLGITRTGRWAVITNYREGKAPAADAPTRGALVANFLTSDLAPLAYLQGIDGERYAGFNLIVGTLTEAAILGNRGTPAQILPAGMHTLSNALLDTPWPKTQRLGTGFSTLDIAGDETVLEQSGLALLADEHKAPDEELPHTGISPEMEKMLSSIRIDSPIYGTRVSSVLILDQHGYRFSEKTLRPVEGELVDLSGDWQP
jgi:uncharacterized protein with NRDE domain